VVFLPPEKSQQTRIMAAIGALAPPHDLANRYSEDTMRKLILAAAIATLPLAAVAAGDQLSGTYRLVSSTRTILDTGEVKDTYGKHPKGFIMYGNDGRFLVQVIWERDPNQRV